jgi:DNA repair ATPase RecN
LAAAATAAWCATDPDKGQVTAVFDVGADHPARMLLRDNDIDDDGDLVFRRVQSRDGRTRVFINDQPASVALMREAGRQLVEIHGQHDDRALVDTATPTAICSTPLAASASARASRPRHAKPISCALRSMN